MKGLMNLMEFKILDLLLSFVHEVQNNLPNNTL